MPLLRFDVIQGRSPDQIRTMLDTAHEAMLESFGVPPGDRYQIVHQHTEHEIHAEDTGLDIPRSRDLIVLQVTSRARTREQKQRFYALLCERLQERCGVSPSDVIVSVITSDDDDWSFGQGRAQFLTGELQ